jgi:hypothetical protein
MTSPSPIQDKAPQPSGLLPKNVQSWLLVSLAVLMVLIMWITGGKKPATPSQTAPSAPAVEAPLEVNEAKIVEQRRENYKNGRERPHFLGFQPPKKSLQSLPPCGTPNSAGSFPTADKNSF